MDTAKELQVLREELIREIDEKIGQQQLYSLVKCEKSAQHGKKLWKKY